MCSMFKLIVLFSVLFATHVSLQKYLCDLFILSHKQTVPKKVPDRFSVELLFSEMNIAIEH